MDCEQFPSLYAVVETGSVTEVTSYLQKTDDSQINEQLPLAVLKAVAIDNVEIIQVLTKDGLLINTLEYDLNPITHALDFQSVNSLRYLISRGANVNAKDENSLYTPLHCVVSNHKQNSKQEECLKELLKTPGIKKNERNKLGRTAVMTAARMGAKNCMEILLKSGCDIHHKDTFNNDVRYFCFDSYHKNPYIDAECFRTLIYHGCCVNDYSLIIRTIEANNNSILSLLVSANVNFNCLSESDKHQIPPLIYAYNRHRDRAISLLIYAGCDVRELPVNRICEQHKLCPERCGMLTMIRTLETNPRTLKELTRIVIRRSLGLRPQMKIDNLGLPKKLQDYILGNDFLQMCL